MTYSQLIAVATVALVALVVALVATAALAAVALVRERREPARVIELRRTVEPPLAAKAHRAHAA